MAHTFVPVPDSQLGVGKPVLSTVQLQLRDNAYATAEGHTDAPRIAHQALSYQDFTTSGSLTVPDYCNKVFVQLCGGGAGSGSGQAQNGGYAEGWYTVTPGDIIAVTVGAGGTGSGTGGSPSATNGSTSSFGSLVSATGGSANPSPVVISAWPGAGTDQQKADWILAVLAQMVPSGRGIGGQFNMSGAIRNFPGFGKGSASNSDGTVYGEAGEGTNGSAHGYDGKSGFVRVWY